MRATIAKSPSAADIWIVLGGARLITITRCSHGGPDGLCSRRSRGTKGNRVVFPPPDERKFRYIKIYVRDSAEEELLYARSTAYTYNLVRILIPYCPQTELAAEYDYWKKFWADNNVDKSRGDRVLRGRL